MVHLFESSGDTDDERKDYCDEVVWEGDRVVAVLRVDEAGVMEVVRFDGPDSPPHGKVVQLASRPADADE